MAVVARALLNHDSKLRIRLHMQCRLSTLGTGCSQLLQQQAGGRMHTLTPTTWPFHSPL